MSKKSKQLNPTGKPKSSATTRSTAGGGFGFEDQIAAFLLVKMLSGEPLPGLGDEGLGSLLHMQTSSLGWLIDDLLAVSESAGTQLALSCKSNTQVAGTGLPDSFVVAAWQQWKASRPAGPFDRAKDRLMLVTRGKHQTFEPLWADIKSWCSHSDNASSLASHIAIADHLWRYWTDDKITLQRTLMGLAEREANFEHSFEISKLDAGDAQAIENKPSQLPLRRNRYNRIEFEHDLAADWIRFQRLKEIAPETERWANLVGIPYG
jgi:hypothetical protein